MTNRTNPDRRLLLAQGVLLALLATTLPALADPKGPTNLPPDRIVVETADERAVHALLEQLRRHGDTVSSSSRLEPYLDCPAHDELRAHGLKAVPYLMEQVSRLREVEEYIGAAAIDSASAVEQVAGWNTARRLEAEQSTVGYHVLNILLHEVAGAGAVHPAGETGIVARRYDSVFRWLDWWRREQGRFVFRTAAPPRIRLPTTSLREEPGINLTRQGDLLAVSAVSRSRRAVLEHVADAAGERLAIFDDPMMSIIVTIHMRSVTFEEFLVLLGRHRDIRGFDILHDVDGAWTVKRAGARYLTTPRRKYGDVD